MSGIRKRTKAKRKKKPSIGKIAERVYRKAKNIAKKRNAVGPRINRRMARNVESISMEALKGRSERRAKNSKGVKFGGTPMKARSNNNLTNITKNTVVTLQANESFLDMNGSATFNPYLFYMNPGNTKLFPTFSTIAACFTNWRLIRCRVQFETDSNQLTVGSQAGRVYAAFNYDPFAEGFEDLEQFEQFNARLRTVPFRGASFSYNISKTKGFDLGGTDEPLKVFVSPNLPNPPEDAVNKKDASVDDYNSATLQLACGENSVTYEIGTWRIIATFQMAGYHEPDHGDIASAIHGYGVPVTGNLFAGYGERAGSSTHIDSTSSSGNNLIITGTHTGTNFMITYILKAATTTDSLQPITFTNATELKIQEADTTGKTEGITTTTTVGCVTCTATSNTLTVGFDSPTLSGACTLDLLITILPTNLITSKYDRLEQKLNNIDRLERMLQDKIDRLTLRVEDDEFDYEEAKDEPNPPNSAKSTTSSVSTPTIKRAITNK